MYVRLRTQSPLPGKWFFHMKLSSAAASEMRSFNCASKIFFPGCALANRKIAKIDPKITLAGLRN
jgi:hypothetical protein